MSKQKYEQFVDLHRDSTGSIQLKEHNSKRTKCVVLTLIVIGVFVVAGTAVGMYFGLDATTSHKSKHRSNSPKVEPKCNDPCV